MSGRLILEVDRLNINMDIYMPLGTEQKVHISIRKA